MIEHTTPLAPDQPEHHVYEPPHAIETEAEGYIDGDWFTKPGRRATEYPWVWATVCKERRTFDISAIKTAGMDAGEALKVAGFLADAVRWATGEVEKLNTTPDRKEAATEQDACGGQM